MTPVVGSTSAKPDAVWRGWLATFLAVLLGGLVCFYAFVLVMDPFSTGRFTLIQGRPRGCADRGN
jgi:hypothetical protein